MKSKYAPGWSLSPLAAMCCVLMSFPVFAAEDNAALIQQGAYVARAARLRRLSSFGRERR